MAKRTISFFIFAVLLFILLAGCEQQPAPDPPGVSDAPSGSASPSQSPAPDYTAQELAGLLLPYAACEDPDALETLDSDADEERLNLYLELAYGLDGAALEDSAVLRATGASAFELAVLRFPDEDAAALAAELLEDYRYGREGDFTGYAPAQADMVHNGTVTQTGSWVGLFLCPDPGAASSAFTAALEGRDLPQEP